MSHKYVYLFTEGNGKMRELLGGKGANLAEMTNIGLPVPQGFTISTEACTKYYEDGRQINPDIQAEIMEYVDKLEAITGKKFGDKENPLLVSLNIQTENPEQTGADLVVGSVAALREHKAPLIVIDMGTATTMAVLDKNGALVGGSISPGLKTSLDALTARTALLPGLQLDKPKRVIGRNTDDAMRSGVMLGAACMIDGMVARMEEELGSPATVIATGGVAKFVVPLCRTQVIYDKDLLLKGLVALYRENTRR